MEPVEPGGAPSHESDLADAPWADDDFWAAFDEPYDPSDRPRPWYRKVAVAFVVLFALGLLGTSALLPWGRAIGAFDNIRDPFEVAAFADEFVEESPWGWLVEDVRVRPIPDPKIGGFVTNNPPDGIVVVDDRSWDPGDLRSLLAHEIGHLIDFAIWRDLPADGRRGGLGIEPWAECAAVDAGYERPHEAPLSSPYHCTDDELAQYRGALIELDVVCKSWGDQGCGPSVVSASN